MVPLAHLSSQPKWHIDRFRCFCTADRRVSLYFAVGCHFPPQNCPFPHNCPFPWGIWTPI